MARLVIVHTFKVATTKACAYIGRNSTRSAGQYPHLRSIETYETPKAHGGQTVGFDFIAITSAHTDLLPFSLHPGPHRAHG